MPRLPDAPLHVLAVADNIPRGTDWWRLVNPCSALPDHGFACAIVPTRLLRQEYYDWADIILFSSTLPNTIESLTTLRNYATAHGKILVKDIDDDHWTPDPTNPFHQKGGDVPPEGIDFPFIPIPDALPMIEASIQCADLVTVTNATLAHRLKERFGREATVLPNCINPDDWTFDRKAVRSVDGLTVGVRGGKSHIEDWRVLSEVFSAIADRFPDITFFVVGFAPDYLECLPIADRIIFHPGAPWTEFPKVLANIDIGLCPLLDTPFNHAKSPVAFYEMAMAGAASVCSRTVYGNIGWPVIVPRDHKWAEDWVEKIAPLIEEAKFRKATSREQREYVLAHANIAHESWRWAKAYKAAVEAARRPKLWTPGGLVVPGELNA